MVSSPSLDRGLGLLEATTLVVGGIIGVSIFVVPGDVAREVGAPGLVLAAYALAGVLAVCAALSFAELAAAIPETGGTYVFLKRAYPGTPIAFLFGWTMFFANSTGAVAVVASIAGIYAGHFLGRVMPYGPSSARAISVALILSLTVVNCLGVRLGGKTQNVLTFLKVAMMVFLVGAAVLLVPWDFGRFLPLYPSDRDAGDVLGSLAAAMVLTLFSFNGAYFVTHVAGEVRDPARNIPRAILIGIFVVFVLYLSLNVVFVHALPFEALQASKRVAQDAASAILGPRGADFTVVAILLSAIGVLNAQLLNYPRIAFALAQDGLFFRRVSRIHPVRRTPAAAILLVGAWAAVLSLSGTYQQILTAFGFVAHTFISLAVAAVLVLRVREPALARPYRVWGYPFTPVFFLIVSALYLASLLYHRFWPTLAGLGIVLAGLPFYYYWTATPRELEA